MNVLTDYTKDRRFVNGFEETVRNEIRKTREYQDFAQFFSGQTLDEFISNKLSEEGTLEVQVSRLLVSKRLELCDRMIFTFRPDGIERYEPTSPVEIAVRKILNQEAFRTVGTLPGIEMECELCGRYYDEPDRGTALYTEEDRDRLLREIGRIRKYRQEQAPEGTFLDYLAKRERVYEEMSRKVRNNEVLTSAGFSIGRDKEDGGTYKYAMQ